jgi:hypothetical protein
MEPDWVDALRRLSRRPGDEDVRPSWTDTRFARMKVEVDGEGKAKIKSKGCQIRLLCTGKKGKRKAKVKNIRDIVEVYQRVPP